MIAGPPFRSATGPLSGGPSWSTGEDVKQGLLEYALVAAFLALAAAGAIALFGDELRGALGLRPPAAAAPSPPPAAPAARQ